jgi:anhydro-N-acetylmuramic acid kinase
VESHPDSVENKLRTVVEHIVLKICDSTHKLPKRKMLVTGGGAHNSFLIHRLKETSKHRIIVPGNELVDYKEALVFAFMGVLRQRNENNCLASVTGAKYDCSSGVICYP